ncbi:MAG: GNAT family N-acetyltransferase, partial [Clostridia bacterium]|nr:GNAT family N-acetyltransferase [Clostridia bacterium]
AALYLSKFYLYLNERRKGYSHIMLDFLKQQARILGLKSIELNVNKHNDAILAYERLGFEIIRLEKNDIGHGYYMDDYVYSLPI